MNIINRVRKRAARAATAAGGIAIAAAGLAAPALAAPAGARSPADGSTAPPVTLHLSLAPMPQVQLVVNAGTVSLIGYGFTPGSSHEVALSFLGVEVPLGTLTARPGGSAHWSASRARLGAAAPHASVRTDAATPGASLVILNAGKGTPVIAQAPATTTTGRFPLSAVEPGYGVIPPGRATLVYQPATRSLSVTVSATGFTPGAHAAHIHAGRCRQQGSVADMLPDFTASSHGVIANETRTITGVRAVELSGGWYLNLHQGDSGDILSKGQPTINFRPLECSNI